MRQQIIKFLLSQEEYQSGEALSAQLGISRAAVWKHIKALREEGAEIDAHTNKGYRLIRLPDLLKPEYIGAYLDDYRVPMRWFEEVGSTNDYGKKWAQEGAEDGSVVVAEHQTMGKGRLNRSWESVPHGSVEMSIVLRPKIPPQQAAGINFAVALGVAAAIEKGYGVSTKIKWPNDITYQNKKICGILTEMSADMDHIEYAVSGAGVNANQETFHGELKEKATSIRIITGKSVNRAQLCAMEIQEILRYYKKYIVSGMSSIIQEYKEKSAVLGKQINVIAGAETYCGFCKGFAEDGTLLVEVDGELRRLLAGEVSIRGMNDYV